MISLLEDINCTLQVNNKTFDDIEWIGGTHYQIPKDVFINIAKETYYNSGYGRQEIAKDLVLCGKDFWLERNECDGSEWWEFKTPPKKPVLVITKPIKLISDLGWETLKEINSEGW